MELKGETIMLVLSRELLDDPAKLHDYIDRILELGKYEAR